MKSPQSPHPNEVRSTLCYTVGGPTKAPMHIGWDVGSLFWPAWYALYPRCNSSEEWARVLFSHDSWCGDQPLRIQLPDIFRMTILNYATVQHMVSWNGGQRHWNITFQEAQMIGKMIAVRFSGNSCQDELLPRRMYYLSALKII